ncbi:MAG: type I addiction module toxin, SymE family [Blautia wexlerae]
MKRIRKIGSMKVYSQNGRRAAPKATPTIILKRQWLEEMGFAGIGDYISVGREEWETGDYA